MIMMIDMIISREASVNTKYIFSHHGIRPLPTVTLYAYSIVVHICRLIILREEIELNVYMSLPNQLF